MFKLLDLLFYLVKLISEKPISSFFLTLLSIFIYNIIFVEKHLITITKTDYSKKTISRFNNEYKDIWGDGVTFVINNSGKNLILESVTYKSNSNMFNEGEDQKTIIPPQKNKVQVLHEKCNYILSTPPKTMKSKNSSTKKYWLHRE